MLVNDVAKTMVKPKGGKTAAFEKLAALYKTDPKWDELNMHPPSATTIADWCKRGEVEWKKAPRAGVSSLQRSSLLCATRVSAHRASTARPPSHLALARADGRR